MSLSPTDQNASGNGAGEVVREGAFAQLFQTAEFGEMGKKCVRLALAGAAAGLLVLSGMQSLQAQTAKPGASVTLVYTPAGGVGSEGAAIDAAGNVYSGTNSAAGIYKSTYSNGSYTTVNIGAGLTSDYVYALAIDSSGNIYAATEGTGTIIKIVPGSGGTYTATTIISGITGGSGSSGVAVDAYGNIYTNNYGNTLYKYIYSGGTYTQHVIGTGFSLTRGLAVDNNGTIYQTDQSAGTVRVFIPSGPVQTTTTYTAGTSFTGLSSPAGVAVKNGIVYIGNNTQLLQETPNGSGGYIQSVAASGFGALRGIAPDNSGNIFVSDLSAGTLPAGLKKVTNALQDFGSVSVGTTSTQQSIAFEVVTAGTLGTPLVLTKGASGLDFKLGTGSTCVGALAANTACVVNVTFTPQYAGERFGAVELTNSSGAVIATSLMQGNGSGPQVSYSPGTISTVAGNGTAGYNGDGIAATSAEMNADDNGPAIDGAGNLYFADLYNGRVRKVTAATGIITTVAGGGSSPSSCSGSTDAVGDGCLATNAAVSPESVAIDGAGNLYIADGGNERIREVTAATGVISTIAGTGTAGYNGDNIAATTAEVSGPYELAVDGLGNVFISDTGNHRIREVSAASGIITTVAGTGTAGYSGDNGAATSAEIGNPRGIAVDATDNLYIADYSNQRIRKVSNTGVITTVAGNGTAGYNGDNIAATSAELNIPLGVAVDAAGDLYIADAGNNRVREVTEATGFITTVAGNGTGGYSGDNGAATSTELYGDHTLTLDNAGDIYISDSGNQRIRKVTTTAAPFSFDNTYVDSVSADSPKTETITNIGNAALTFEVPGVGDNPSISSGFTIGNSSTCPLLSTISSAGTLAAGASCTDLLSFAPQIVGTISGSTVTTDNTLNVANSSQSVGLSGTALPLLTKTITFPQPTTPVTAGSSATLTATTSNSDPVTYSITSGAATINGSTITYTNTGTVVIAANSAQTADYAAAATVSDSVVVNAAPSSYTAPTENVGSSSGAQIASVNFTTSGTLGAINVVTKGAPNLDFNYVSGGTCTVGSTYTAGEVCTVLYSFTPLYPGAREGAVVLETSGGSVLGTSYLGGTGIAPLGLFTTTSQTLNVTGLNGARGLSADGYGNLYVLETGSGKVDKIAAGTNTVTTLTTLGTGTGATAVDGAGNLYVGIEAAGTIYELVGGKLPAITLVTGTCGNDDNLETDGAGNLYFSCYSGGAIYRVNTGSHTLTQLLAGGAGHRFIGMAADAAGNIYAPDFNNAILFELPFGANSLTTLVTGGALSNPHGVAVDPAGNIYVTNINGSNILRYAAGTYGLTVLPAAGQRGIAIDGEGDLYTLTSDSTIAEYTRTTAPGLTFPNTPVGTSSNSLQTVEFENDGNAPLAITSYSATTNFNVGGAGNTCATGSLASGATCFVGAVLAPTAVGSLTGTASIVDNTLNLTGTSQNIPLSGTGTLGSKTITFPALPTPVTVNSTATLAATASNGDPVTYSIISGTATINGSTITYTNVGPVTIAANSVATSTYAAAAQVTQTITVNQIAQTISFTPASPVTYGVSPITLSATGGASGNAVTFSIVSGPGSITGNTLTITGAGTVVVAANQLGNTNYSAAPQVTASIVVNKATASVTPASATKIYGTSDPSFSGTLTGFLPSDGVTATYSRTAGETVSGSYTISAVLAPTAVLSNYNITYNTVPFTITKATLTVTVNPASSVYGAAFPAFSGTLSGVVAGDGITASYSTIATPTSPAGGSYSITATLNDPNSKLSNYNVTNTPATLTINRAALSVTVNPASSVYGATFPAFSGTLSGVVAGDGITASYSTTATPTSPAGGSYSITATLNDPNSKLSNYNVTNIPAVLTITQAMKTIVFPALASPVAVNGTATLAATTSNGDPVTYSIVSGAANINGTTITFTNDGSVTIAAYSASTTNYLAAATVTDTVVVNAAAISYAAPTEPVGSTTATQTATVNFTAGGTLSAINVLTQGATGLDFNVVSGGTCAVGSAYTTGQACTVQYSFTPQEPGVRLGAITLVSDSGSLLGTSYLGGTGTGPQAIFSNGGQSVFQNTSGTLNGITSDASGNVYYSTFGTGNNGVYKVAAGNGNTTQIASVSFGSGIVVDGAGNIFYSDYGANTVNELVGGTGTPVLIASEPNPEGLALDLQGNLYVDVGVNVIKLLAGSFAPSTTYGTGLAHAQSVAVDAAGNVYITDRDGAQAVVVTPDGLTQTPIATGISTPAGITLDAAGNIYVAVIGGAEVEEYAAGTYTPTTLGSFTQPAFVALDPSGNILVIDRGANAIEKLTRATPALLSFATTPEGSTSSDSPQTLTLGNNGNAPLVLSGLSTATTSFTLSGSSTCTSSTNLASNGSCTIGVNFAPTVPGSPLTDAVTITDNNLNVAGAAQTAQLSGTGTQQTATITVAPASISYTTTPTTLSATVAYLGATAPSGAVSFTIDGGSAIPASCTGTSSPLTCTASYATGILSATAHTITATLAADTDFAIASGSAALTVTPIAPTITFTIPNHTYGDAPVILAATSNSGAAITYSVVSGPATVTGSTLSITGAGPVTVQAAQIAAGNYIAGSQNASFTAAQLALTAAVVGNPTKTYDGTTSATLTSANYQLTPLVGTDAITVTQPTGVYASATAGPEGVTAALSAANYSAVSGLLSNYILPAVATGPGTITQATASVTPNAATKIYGTGDPSFSGMLNGFVATDGVTATYSRTAGEQVVGSPYSISAVLVPSAVLANYNITYNTAAFTITPASASVTPAAATKTYGTVDPPLTGTLSGFLAADNVTAIYSRTAGEQVVGLPYSISAVLSPNAVLSNYNITYNTAAFTITPASASVTPAFATKIYGTIDPTLTGTLSGFLAADNVTATYSRTAGVNVGNYSTSAVLSPTGVLGNYNITYNTAAFTITPAKLSATIIGTPTKSYDGTTTASLSAANYQLNGVVAGDLFLVNQPAGAYAAATAGPESVTALLGASNFSAVNGLLTNYILPSSATGPGTITKAVTSSTITWNTPSAITYGTALSTAQLNASSTVAGSFSYTPPATTVLGAGTQTLNAVFTPTDTTDYLSGSVSVTLQVNPATPTITWTTPAPITYGTALNGTQLNATASVAGTFSYSPASGVLTAGSHTLSVTFTPTDGTDYTTASLTVTLQVNQATPTIIWATPASFAYGTALNGTQLNATASVAGTFSYIPASGTVLTAGSHLLSVTFTPTDGVDYTTASAVVTQVVTQVTPTINWANPSTISYGTHLSGTQLNASASVAGSFSYNPVMGSVLTAGPHVLTATFTPNDTTDYTTATTTVNITITPIALTVTAGSPTMIYGSTLPTIAPSYSGFIAGDSASNLTTQPNCTTTATSTSNVGSYPTSCASAVDANYVISYKPGILSITPAVLTVAANKLSFAYGGGDGDNDEDEVTNPMTYTITGFAPGQTAVTDLTGKPSETSNTPEGGPVGSYTITMSAGSLKLKPAYSSDYTISYVSAPLVITPAVLTVTATSQSDVYGTVDTDNCGHPERHLNYTINGFAYNQNQYQVLNGSPTVSTTATTKSGVGTYPITITQGSLTLNRNYANDYTLVFVNGTLTVTPAKLYVVANSYNRQINTANPAFAYTINGFVNGDTQSGATTGAPACCTTTAVTGSPAGVYPITIAAGSLAARNGNYTLNLINGVLIVYNPRDRNDPHCDGYGNFRANQQFDHDNWPDSSSFNFYWGNGGGGPNINNWFW